ncbi:4-deoxy-L-threo-5-hexulose uronate isomerase [Ruaniaceae bacterium KH17]|nr:4-deoxy-L-threo-5-hexulose uronate isomerase [Ruaniaceae bacterium KH17]
MEQRYAVSPDQIPGMDTQEMRDRFLVQDLFVPGEVKVVYTHHDRIVLGGATPADGPLALPTFPEMRAEFFLERREIGIISIAETGTVTADGEAYEMPKGSALYLGRGTKDVVFEGEGAQFYLFSAPAHTSYPNALVLAGQGTVRELGDQSTSNRRSLNQYIHENGIKSCQIVMGVTSLHEGSMWNTMPAHTHDRRTECYLYFDVPEDARVVHILGEPSETRHMVVANKEAIISPSWSVHSGVGTAAYSFVWAMAGENQSFDDMDGFSITTMR